MEKGRSTWQMWHVRAEAQRQVRTADVPVNREQVCWWICSSRRCWSAGLLPLPDRMTTSRNRIIQRSPFLTQSVPLRRSRRSLRRVMITSPTLAQFPYRPAVRCTSASCTASPTRPKRPSGRSLSLREGYIPGLTAEPAWPTLRAHALALAAETGEHPLRHMLRAASEGDLGTADDMAAVLDWRLTALTPTDPGPLPWLPGLPSALHDHPVWGGYLAKRSQLVADLADQVQDHACRGAGEPAWAPPGSHPSLPLIREIAVWRAANGINPQDSRPTGGGGQLGTAAALWKQRLDWHTARSTDPSGTARYDERHAAHTPLSRSQHDSRRPYQTPGQRPNRPAGAGR